MIFGIFTENRNLKKLKICLEAEGGNMDTIIQEARVRLYSSKTEARASIVGFHGLTDCGGGAFGPVLVKVRRKYNVYLVDLPQHQEYADPDNPWFAIAPRFRQCFKIARAIVEAVANTDKKLPVFAFGHSFGGALAVALASSQMPATFTGSVGASVPFDVYTHAPEILQQHLVCTRLALYLASHLAPCARMPEDSLSEEARSTLLDGDSDRIITFRNLENADTSARAVEWILKARSLRYPGLFLHGENDVVSPGWERLRGLVSPISGCEMITFPGASHRLIEDAPESVDAVLNWANARVEEFYSRNSWHDVTRAKATSWWNRVSAVKLWGGQHA